jgi:acyl dehydratase
MHFQAWGKPDASKRRGAFRWFAGQSWGFPLFGVVKLVAAPSLAANRRAPRADPQDSGGRGMRQIRCIDTQISSTSGIHLRQSMNPRFYEDYAVGELVEATGVTLTEAELIHFALAYDPQPFHTDTLAAKESIYGGLIASGWQVAVVAFKMLVQAGLVGTASLGSPGIEQLRWLKPVRPGDTIYARAKITAARLSQSKPDRGLVTIEWWVENQHREIVSTFVSTQLVRRRPVP